MLSIFLAMLMAPAELSPPPPKAVTNPTLVGKFIPPDVRAARALGHNGIVRIRGVVGIDGRVSNLSIVQSSKSSLLDTAAKTAIERTVFQPAKDASGNPVPLSILFPFEFEGDGISRAGWLADYTCSQFGKDFGWWRSVNLASDYSDYRLYSIMAGLKVISDPNGLASGLKNAAPRADWERAILDCAAHPDTLMIDQFSTAAIVRNMIKRGQI